MSSNNPMSYNFDFLKERTMDTLALTNLNKQLKKIKGNTLCIGSGGSKVVAAFSSIVLSYKNGCSTKVMEPRDVLYENINAQRNLFVCSYSGSNQGVEILKPLKSKKYLLTYSNNNIDKYKNLQCKSSIDKEMSFISLAATLMPMTILLSYYVKNNSKSLIENIFNNCDNIDYNNININLPFELMSGYDTQVAETYLESTFVESGLSDLIVHHKYDYCHGRSTLSYKQNKNLIYLLGNKTELDDLLLEQLKTRYNSIIILKSDYKDIVLSNYDLTIKAMYLTKNIATLKNVDLSIVEYDKPLSKVLYKYKGKM